MEDESVTSYIDRISKIITGIKSCNGTKDEDEIILKILKKLTPPFKKTVQMIEQVMPCTEKFTKIGIRRSKLEIGKRFSQSGN